MQETYQSSVLKAKNLSKFSSWIEETSCIIEHLSVSRHNIFIIVSKKMNYFPLYKKKKKKRERERIQWSSKRE